MKLKKNKLIKAIENCNYEVIDEFINKNSIYKPILNGLNLMLISIEIGNLQVVKYLVEKGFDITFNNKDHYFPIEYACLCNHFPIIQYLCDANPKVSENNCALVYASSKGLIDIVIYLLEKGFSVNQLDYSGRNALHWVAQEGYYNIADLLIRNGCDINKIDEDGSTPLYVAAGENRVEIVHLLIQNNANIDLTEGMTPFSISCVYNYYDVADALYKAGAQVDYVDDDGRSTLFYAMVRQDKELIDYLTTIGASKNITDNYGIQIKDLHDEGLRLKVYKDLY